MRLCTSVYICLCVLYMHIYVVVYVVVSMYECGWMLARPCGLLHAII